MGHVICFVKTGPNQSIVKLNVFNCFGEIAKLHLTNTKRMDAKVSHKPCSCPSFKILYIVLLGLKPVHHLGRVLF
jgi:hypothetical protein